MTGRLVQTIVNEQKSAGNYTANWNASNMSSGVYIYAIKIFDESSNKLKFTQSEKCILMK